MTENSSKIVTGVLFMLLVFVSAKLYMETTTPQTYYRFTVKDKTIGRYESLEQCARDEVIYRQVHQHEEISPYQTSCDWK